MPARKIILSVLICVSELAHQGNAQGLNSFMQNTAALIGDTSTSLTCGAETAAPTYVYWAECIPGAGCDSLGYDDTFLPGYTGHNRLVPTGNTGEFRLEIPSLAVSDAGQYRCWATLTPTSESYAEVIALASDPTCHWNITDSLSRTVQGDYIGMTCEVGFSGRWAPVTTWKGDGLGIESDESTATLAKYSVTVVAVPSLDQQVYETTTQFDPPTDTGAGEATNAPGYQNKYMYPTLTVQFGPYNIVIDPQDRHFFPGDMITSSAVGNPTPTYKWIDMNTTATVALGPELLITKYMLGTNSYRCEATNTDFRGTVHTEFKDFTFEVYATTLPTTTATNTAITNTASTTPDGNDTSVDCPEAGSGMSGGEIAGIIVLIVVFVMLAVVVTLVVLQIRIISSKHNKDN